jgi:hypothetical protein
MATFDEAAAPCALMSLGPSEVRGESDDAGIDGFSLSRKSNARSEKISIIASPDGGIISFFKNKTRHSLRQPLAYHQQDLI